MTKPGETTFVEISNRDIYNKIVDVEKHVIKTNGTVKMNKVTSRTALILALISLSILTGINLIPLFI